MLNKRKNTIQDVGMTPVALRRSTCDDFIRKFSLTKAGYAIIVLVLFERAGYYGLTTLLTVYLTEHMKLSKNLSTSLYHLYASVGYLFAIVGGVISDNYLGRFKTITLFGALNIVAYIVMTLTSLRTTLPGTLTGILLIAIFSGCFKPCIAAFGADQIPLRHPEKIDSFFTMFYTSVNIGAAIAIIIIPMMEDVPCVINPCYPLSFGISACLFFISYVIFVSCKPIYKMVPKEKNAVTKFVGCLKHSVKRWIKERRTIKKEDILDYADDKYNIAFIRDAKAALDVMVVFIPFPIFWALYDQQGSRWIIQAQQMDGYITPNINIKPEQMLVFNPLFIIFMIPIFETIIYPLFKKCNILQSRTSRIVTGYIFAAISFTVAGIVQIVINNGLPVEIATGRAQLQFPNLVNQTFNISSKHWTSPIILNPLATNDFEVASGSFNITAVSLNESSKKTFSATIDAPSGKYVSVFILNNDKFRIQSGVVNSKVIGEFEERVRIILTFPLAENSTVIASPLSAKRPLNKTLLTWNTISDTFIGEYVKFEHGRYSLLLIDPNDKDVKIGDFEVNLTASVTIVISRDSNGEFDLEKIMESKVKLISRLFQLPQYLIMTCAELFLSVTAMAFAYEEAPNSMKTLMQASYLMTSCVGNIIVIIITNIYSSFKEWEFQWDFFVFAILVLIAGLINGILNKRYNQARLRRERYSHFLVGEMMNSVEL